jgi:polyisoprenoid-binding protein YceI
MKTILMLCIAMLTLSQGAVAQKYVDKKGSITFEASEKLFEPVKATNTSVTAILNTETNAIAALALVKSFRFKNSLMEEHFNENYIESETYPKAIFKGQLKGVTYETLTETVTEVSLEGTLELHGKTKAITTLAKLQKLNNEIVLSGTFSVAPADFDIEIPKVVEKKIAKAILISYNFNLVKK